MTAAYRDLLLDHVGVTDAQRASMWRDAIEYALGVVSGPAVTPYPAMTPETWADMRCRDGRRCHCDFCVWETRNRPRVQDWARAQSLRPQPRKPHPFGSDGDVASKLEAYARDGATAPSYMGPMLDRTRDEAALGARMARDTGGSRDPAGIYHAGLRADAWRCYLAACSGESVRQGASTAETVRVTLLAQLGGDVPEALTSLARRARWAVRVELAARELIPAPPVKATRMCRAVEARRAELSRRA
jgi:hypothetical protein